MDASGCCSLPRLEFSTWHRKCRDRLAWAHPKLDKFFKSHGGAKRWRPWARQLRFWGLLVREGQSKSSRGYCFSIANKRARRHLANVYMRFGCEDVADLVVNESKRSGSFRASLGRGDDATRFSPSASRNQNYGRSANPCEMAEMMEMTDTQKHTSTGTGLQAPVGAEKGQVRRL